MIILKYEVMAADEWHNGPQDLVMVSLCIKMSINKMLLCSLFGVYAHTITPPPPMEHCSQRWHQQTTHPYDSIHVVSSWGQLDVLTNSLKQHWRRLTVEKWTFNYLATALVDSPAVSLPIALSLNICGIVLCDKTAQFRVAFNCLQHKMHLCNAMLFDQLLYMSHMSGGLSWQSRNAH
jgi:hypothetical protein